MVSDDTSSDGSEVLCPICRATIWSSVGDMLAPAEPRSGRVALSHVAGAKPCTPHPIA